MINTGRYASNHGGLLIYLNKMWTYKIKKLCHRFPDMGKANN